MGRMARFYFLELLLESTIYGAVIFAFRDGTAAGLLKTVAVCLGVALLLRALITLKMFRDANRFCMRDWPPEATLSWGGRARLFFGEWWSVVRLFTLYHPFERLMNRQDPATTDGSIPVLLIHGYVCNGGFWFAMKPMLRSAGFSNLYTITMEPPFGDIEDFAAQVAARVDGIRAATGAEKVVLIGHSMGGLVSRCYVQRHGGDECVERVITLGTPHHGTVFAKGGIGKDSRQMEPKSEWLAALNAETPKPVPITSIWTTHDNIVAPQDSAILEHAENVRLVGIGHLELCDSQPMFEAVRAALPAP